MEEIEWLTSVDPEPMLKFLKDNVSDRKLRLFAVACFRSPGVWPCLQGNKLIKNAVWKAEQIADGREEWPPLRDYNFAMNELNAFMCALLSSRSAFSYAADRGFENINLEWANGDLVEISNNQYDEEKAYQCRILRCIFGNPFRQVTFEQSWFTTSVIEIANFIYEEKAFGRMTELGKELLEAGCIEEAIIDHCRDTRPHPIFDQVRDNYRPGQYAWPHARGCWVLDQLLGKESSSIDRIQYPLDG
jgi:hypothetical protein